MKKKLPFVLLSFILLFTIMQPTVNADIGPKPSVVIKFEGLEGKTYYVTLLSDAESTGPHSILGKHPNNQRYHKEDQDYEIWRKFLLYKDKDRFYFLQYFQNCTDTSKFTWGYYPPKRFKILIYFPEQDSFAVSNEVYERYAFDSYYKVDARGLEISSDTVNYNLTAKKDYDFTWEIISLFARIFATIAIEILIALLFGFKARKQIFIITAINIATQTILYILLNIFNYSQGSMAFVIHYIWMELLVIVIEIFALSMLLKKYYGSVKKRIVRIYTILANVISFALGLYIAKLIPGIF